ncbi:MAG: D-alanyl-D-alanine carboxypeptidase family protein, partial [Actinomycetota bacterium]|nr:D-alanyl-D-alanine carboxypeptidase family protein [Actinomycetota bacterium]
MRTAPISDHRLSAARNNERLLPTGTKMSGINEIQSRIQSIQTRVASPPIAGRFNAVFEAQMAAANARAIPPTEAPSEASAEGGAEFAVTPQGQTSTALLGGTSLTLGVMLGITGSPEIAPRSGTVTRSADLNEYLRIHNIESRNGRLSPAELTPVSGGWNGTGRLLPPAASAWEEMRVAAATEGIDLKAIDTYRSWETQEQAYLAHLRGDKAANVLPPGESEHGNGLAIDVTNGHLVGVGDAEYTWLRTNGAQYGWYPISNESWHWEFRGTVGW